MRSLIQEIFVPVLIALLLPVAVFAYVSGDPNHQNDARAATLSKELANELDRLLQFRLRETFSLAALPSFRALASADPTQRAAREVVAQREMIALVEADTNIREVFELDALGYTILTTGDKSKFGVNWANREFVGNALNGKLDVSPPSRDDGEFSNFYAAPIIDNSGNVAGVLVLRIVSQEIWNSVYAARETDCCYAVLTDEYAVRLADANDQTKNLYAWTMLDGATLARLMGNQQYGAEMTQWRSTNAPNVARVLKQANPPPTLNADGYAGAVTRLKTKPWTVFVVTPRAFPIPYLSMPLLFAVLAAFVCAAGLTWLFGRRMENGK